MLKSSVRAICAGIAISIGGIAYLASGNPWTFPIGLFMVCFFKFDLFTGKISYIEKVKEIPGLLWMWALNILVAYGVGVLVHYMRPDLVETAYNMVLNKSNEGLWVIPRAILCNIMIFVAVHSWKQAPSPKNVVGLIFATAIFVICGFEHCIANAFYIGCALAPIGMTKFLLLNSLGNAIGGIAAYQATQFIKEPYNPHTISLDDIYQP